MFDIQWIAPLIQLLLVFLATILIYLYFQSRQTYKFWTKLGVQQLNPVFPIGDLSTAAFGLDNIILQLQYLYDQFKAKNQRFGGIYFFNGPIFLPTSADLYYQIFAKDFEYFSDRGIPVDSTNPLSANLLSVKLEQWKAVRTKMAPHFTPMKIKNMSHIFFVYSKNFVDFLKKYTNGDDFDMKQLAIRFTSDVISAAALGVERDSFKNPDSDFIQMINDIFFVPLIQLMKAAITDGFSKPGNILKLIYNNQRVKRYFTGLIRNIVEYRKKNNISRNDVMNVLIQMKNNNVITIDNVIGESYLLFLAGYETTGSTTSFALHELAHNQQIQDRLRSEIVAKLGKNIDQYRNQYDDILKLPYLEKVIKETLRKYPPTTTIFRRVVKPYNIPATDIVLPVNTPVIMSIFALHRDPEYFPDPLKFDPERFDDEKSTISPNSYLPFGDGPRYCLGKRFAMSQIKIVLSLLIASYKFLPGKKSQPNLPIITSTSSPVLQTKDGIPLKIVKI